MDRRRAMFEDEGVEYTYYWEYDGTRTLPPDCTGTYTIDSGDFAFYTCRTVQVVPNDPFILLTPDAGSFLEAEIIMPNNTSCQFSLKTGTGAGFKVYNSNGIFYCQNVDGVINTGISSSGTTPTKLTYIKENGNKYSLKINGVYAFQNKAPRSSSYMTMTGITGYTSAIFGLKSLKYIA